MTSHHSSPRPGDRDNRWVAAQLREIAARLDLDDGPHRPRAYRRAAETLEALESPVAKIRAQQGVPGLDALPAIGPHIAAVICELLDTGRSALLERLRKKVPMDVVGLLAVDGVGPKTLKILWERLQIRGLEDLERALREGRVQGLPGFGKRREARLLEAVRVERRGTQRMDLGRAAAIAKPLVAAIAKLPSVEHCSVAGSIRRGVARVGDIDLVAASDDPEAVAEVLLTQPGVEHVYSRGPHRVSVRLDAGIDVDLRTVRPASLGSALLYFTGSRAHTLALRRLALAQGLRLNEYGLFRGRRRIASATEREIYEALSIAYVPPEDRRGEAEIREALRARSGELATATRKNRHGSE